MLSPWFVILSEAKDLQSAAQGKLREASGGAAESTGQILLPLRGIST